MQVHIWPSRQKMEHKVQPQPNPFFGGFLAGTLSPQRLLAQGGLAVWSLIVFWRTRESKGSDLEGRPVLGRCKDRLFGAPPFFEGGQNRLFSQTTTAETSR